MKMRNIKLVDLNGGILEEVNMTETDIIMGDAADIFHNKYNLKVIKQFDSKDALFSIVIDNIKCKAKILLDNEILSTDKSIIVEKL